MAVDSTPTNVVAPKVSTMLHGLYLPLTFAPESLASRTRSLVRGPEAGVT